MDPGTRPPEIPPVAGPLKSRPANYYDPADSEEMERPPRLIYPSPVVAAEPIDAYPFPRGDEFTNPPENYRRSHFRAIQICQNFVIFTNVALGFCVLLTHKGLRSTEPHIFWYIVATLTAELVVTCFVGLLLLVIKLLVGSQGACHANALCGILRICLEALVYYATLGVGVFLVVQVLYRVPRRVPSYVVLVYMALEMCIGLLFTVQTIPTWCGALKYAYHKIEMKLLGVPEVVWQAADGPIHYSTLADYAVSLRGMSNPTTSSGGGARAATAGMDGDVEMGPRGADLHSSSGANKS
eukprot:GHVT01101442.1.p1 GENE.GHVT01101442.1~~GHVT01101442.1.p1  ORF type:complete len:297 (-),score=17.27 GHVT01101442.1:122-1012(-)